MIGVLGNMKRFKKVVNSALAFTVAAFTLAGAFSVEVQAEEVLEYTETTDAAGEQNSDGEQAPADLQVMQSIVSDTIVKAFIKNPSVLGVSDYQIGNVKCEDVEQHGNSQDAYPMRTLILLDNSESIPTNMRDTVKEYIKKIIECHAEGERFRLATFSDTIQYLQDDYSDDYTALSNVVEAIEYHDQDTYLTDVLYELLKELNANDYKGYVRLVVISDGVDNKEIGITKLERDESFKSRNYPVYTVGIDTGKNSSMLSEMFALSRTTGAGYLVLEKDKAEEAAQTVIGDNEITVMQAHIPDKLQNGSEMNSLITFSNGQTLEFYVKMPFGEEPEEIIIEASVYESGIIRPLSWLL